MFLLYMCSGKHSKVLREKGVCSNAETIDAPKSLSAVVAMQKMQPIIGLTVPEGCLKLWLECVVFGWSLPQFAINKQQTNLTKEIPIVTAHATKNIWKEAQYPQFFCHLKQIEWRKLCCSMFS